MSGDGSEAGLASALRLEAYLDERLDAASAAALVEDLRRGGPMAAQLRAQAAFAGLLAQAADPTDAEAVARAVAERIDAESRPSALVRSVDRGIGRATRRRSRPARAWRWWPAAAAAAVFAVAALAWSMAGPATGPVVVGGEGRLADGSAASGRLHPGILVEAATVLRLAYPDGSAVALEPGARLRIDGEADGMRLHLEHGAIEAQIAHQPAGRPCRISTPDCRIEVVGTSFRLAAAEGRSELVMASGEVRVACDDGRSLAVRAGERAEIVPGRPLVARPAHAVATALFPDGLAGWRQLDGIWTIRDGVVRGSAPAGRSRLASARDYRDVELTCRMRIVGAEVAELQVGDYNWFARIPAVVKDGGWTEVRLTKRGGVLACTAGGQPVEFEPGVGQDPARPGCISVYIRTGSLEIADALITEP